MTDLKNFDGILWIGDPHVCSKRVGRRKAGYLDSVLEKLEFCAQLANTRNLLPIFLGDMFHYPGDNQLRMLNRLIRVLKTFATRPVSLEGNHDRIETTLSDDDALELLRNADALDIAGESGLYRSVLIKGTKVNIWACPQGSALPESLQDDTGVNLLMTHHDMAFGKAYINATPLKAIKGCQMAINGHMHDTKPVEKAGDTWWVNPGNIEPLSVDLKHHVPKGWIWTPASLANGELEGVELPHGEDLFDLTGLEVKAADSLDGVQDLVAQQPMQSQFAALVVSNSLSEATRTDDASVLASDVNSVLSASVATEAAQLLMHTLLTRLQEKTIGSAVAVPVIAQ